MFGPTLEHPREHTAQEEHLELITLDESIPHHTISEFEAFAFLRNE